MSNTFNFFFLPALCCLCSTLPLHAQSGNFAKSIAKHRKHYKKEFLQEARSPLSKKDLKYLEFYPAKEKYRVQATFTPLEDQETFEMATYSGITKPYFRYGRATFTLDGQSYEITFYKSPTLSRMPMYRDYLFVPFKDATNGETTYGGGRYLDMRTSDIQNGNVWIDFNKAYNPYCAYSDGYHCPVPPVENHLDILIEAGEKNFGKEK